MKSVKDRHHWRVTFMDGATGEHPTIVIVKRFSEEPEVRDLDDIMLAYGATRVHIKEENKP
jgi:hypothetical protein